MIRIQSTALVIYAQPIKLGIGMVVTVLLARLLTPEDYGLMAAAQTFIGFLSVFSGLGLYEAAVQKRDFSESDANAFFFLNLAIGVSLLSLSAASAPLLAHFYEAPALISIVPVLSLSFLFAAIGHVNMALLARRERFKVMVALELATQLSAACGSIAAALAGWNYWSLVVLSLLRALVQSVGAWFLVSWRPRVPSAAQFVNVWSSVRFGVGVAAGNWINFLAAQVDRMVVGKAFAMETLGYYTRAHQLAMYANNILFVGPHRFVTARLARLQEQPDEYRREILRLLSIALWGATAINTLFYLNSELIILFVFGEKWLPMGRIFEFVAIGNIAFVLAFAYQWLYLSLGRGTAYVRENGIRLVLVLVAVSMGLPWGVEGVAAAYGLTVWFMSLLTARSCARLAGGSTWLFLRTLWRPALLAFVSGSVACLGFPQSEPGLVSAIGRSGLFMTLFTGLSFIWDRKTFVMVGKMAGRLLG